MGAASIMFIATANSLLQLHSTGIMRGRVMALWAIVFLGSTPIGAPLVGYLAGRYGARFALGVGGAATVMVSVWAAFELRRIRASLRIAASRAAMSDATEADYPATDGHAIEGIRQRQLEPAGKGQPG